VKPASGSRKLVQQEAVPAMVGTDHRDNCQVPCEWLGLYE
jgi:hypothetical protein